MARHPLGLVLGLTLAVAVGAAAGFAKDCSSCFDPPRDPWIRHSLALEDVILAASTGVVAPLDGDSELVLVFEVTHLGSCPSCAQTYVKYLPLADVDEDRNLTVVVDEVVYSMAECWPPSKIAIRAAMFEEDMPWGGVWETVKALAFEEMVDWSGRPLKNPAQPWSVRISGAWFDQLVSALSGEDIVMAATRWEYDHSPIRLPTGDWSTYWKYPRQGEGIREYKTTEGTTAISFGLSHAYSQPSGTSCSAQQGQTGTGETTAVTPQSPTATAAPTLPESVSSAARSLAWKSGRLGRTDPSARWDAREDQPGDRCEPCGNAPMCVVCMESDLQAWQGRRKTIEELFQLTTVLSYLRSVAGQPQYDMMAALYWDSYWDGWHNRDAP